MSVNINLKQTGNHHALAELLRSLALWLDSSNQTVNICLELTWDTKEKHTKEKPKP